MPTKIVIDPTSRILYAGYYILGLHEVFGRKNVSFGRKPFTQLKRIASNYDFEHYFAFVTVTENRTTKYVVDFCDPPDINPVAYDWCDKYAKINFNRNAATDLSKIIIIPPGFGIRIWSLPRTILLCAANFIKAGFSVPTRKINFLKDYYHHYQRPALCSYFRNQQTEKRSGKAYVFMIGTLWTANDHAIATNEGRKQFVEACIGNEHVDFEGGFYASPDHNQYDEYKKLLLPTFYPIDEYLKKTHRSRVVFNTPAVHNCHGWKLAEYLALGKAIISTPLSNELPCELEHGKEIHIIHDQSEIPSALQELISNEKYNQSLQRNARDYFRKYMTPKSVVAKIVGVTLNDINLS